MNKLYVKQISSLISQIDGHDYISNVKYVIFIICKILFAFKLRGKYRDSHESLEDLFNSIGENHMDLFQDYDFFDLNQDSIEVKIYNILTDIKYNISHEDFIPANLYEILMTKKEKKSLGQVYTPYQIVDEMLTPLLKDIKTTEKTKILDPACGGGYFLIEIFKRLRNMNKAQISEQSDRYILENIIYGADIDEFSIFLTKMGLIFNSLCLEANINIYKMDFLTELDDINMKFDLIITNPPYIGHKQTDKYYRAKIKEKYGDIFYDKSDIYYCFFKAGKALLKGNGVISYITSRYFMEAMYANKLRKFLKNEFKIISIIDYSGIRVFKGAMISPIIINLSNDVSHKGTFSYCKCSNNQSDIISYRYDQAKLKDSGWIILNDAEERLFNKIESLSNTFIDDICSIRQGIISGLDKAFIVNEEQICINKIENHLLKRWIKNSNISKNEISYKNLYLIYSNMIEDEEDCPNAIKYLSVYKDKLSLRRECINGFRKWYELQWSRVASDFEEPKIVFPYKSYGNNFYLDNNGYFCSADIYIIKALHHSVTFDFLKNYLNSKTFEFYFKCCAKKVGINLYEYYPNKLKNMKIYIPCSQTFKNISDLNKISIDNFLEKVFNITLEEKRIIDLYNNF